MSDPMDFDWKNGSLNHPGPLMRSLERVVETRIDMLELEKAEEIQEDCAFCRSLDCDIIFALAFTFVIACLLVLIMVFWLRGVLQYEDYTSKFKKKLKTDEKLFENIQCIYTYVAGQRQRVKLEFDEFQLAGTADNCDLEYVDIYSELKSPSDDLLSITPFRYCGTVSPHIRISLYNVLVLVFHSRVGKKRNERLRLSGRYQFISNSRYIPGRALPGELCSFIIDASTKRKGQIVSPTYPGTYPSNFHCTYLLRSDNLDDRIHVSFKDFDIYFGGEHCPYDMMTVYDGPTNHDPIIRKVCGLQQNLEAYSIGPTMFLEFNTTDPAKSDPRGYVIEYEFDNKLVNIKQLLDNQKGATHLRGSECDIRIQSNRETIHYIQSPNFPNIYPPNATCTYVIDGLQGDQNLEKVVLEFEIFAVYSKKRTGSSPTDETGIYECEEAYVGIAANENSVKSVLASNEESSYDVTLCERLKPGSDQMGPYSSSGPRMVLVFGSWDMESAPMDSEPPYGFRAKIEFKTDFGIPGEAVGDSNKCLFRFKNRRGSFNSPRYPANYPLDTNCTYFIQGQPGDQILLYFEQFALFEEKSTDECNDWLEIYDLIKDEKGDEQELLQAKHCWTIFPGPTISTFGSHEMKVVFSSDSFGTANGFKALYEIRRAFKESVPSKIDHSDSRHCGHLIQPNALKTSGFFYSPGYPVKYSKDLICDWEIQARSGHQILLKLVAMDVEGEITDKKVSCKDAIIRIHINYDDRTSDKNICGTNPEVMKPIVSNNETIRISFMTNPEKVNGLQGFNFSWTEVKLVQQDSECAGDDMYLCSYTRLCIHSRLKCDGDENCGGNDDTDEAHCNIAEKDADKKTVIIAAVFSIGIFGFIFMVFAYLFYSKYQRRKKKNLRKQRLQTNSNNLNGQPRQLRQRHPYRSQQPLGKNNHHKDDDEYDGYLPSPATSRFINHDAFGQLPPAVTVYPSSSKDRTSRSDSKSNSAPSQSTIINTTVTPLSPTIPPTVEEHSPSPEDKNWPPPKSGQYTFYG
uniref:CUB domain-containing protein n=1 Tax=Panagrolaimus sp. JU765 TaxID=591449 RepID=A0AC34QJ52_9BILA